MNNKKILVIALIVVALVGFFMMVDKKSDEAIANAEPPAVQEQTIAQSTPETTQPVVAETQPAEPAQEEAPAQPSLGASSSGLGR